MIKKLGWKTTLLTLLIIELIFFGLLNPRFLNINSLLYNVGDFLYIAVAALGMTMILASGGIDISAGATMGLASIVAAILWTKGVNIWVASILGIVAGGGVGFVNGFLIILTEINPLVITLGNSFLVSGLSLIVSGFAGATGFEGISGLPMSFGNLINGMILGVPNSVWILLIMSTIFYIILHKTKFGRYMYLIGMNPDAADYSGINVNKLVIYNYIIMGMVAASSGIFLTSYFTSARADLGGGSELSVITAAVLGGASIYGGKGSIIGTVLASFLIGYLKYGLQMIRVSSQATNVYLGLILIATISGRYFWGKYSSARENKKVTN